VPICSFKYIVIVCNKNDNKLKVAKFLKIRLLGGEAYHPVQFLG